MGKKLNIYRTVLAFLEHPTYTMIELSELPELNYISKSSIQRYLNDPIIIDLFDEETFNKIQSLLKENSLSGRKKGGMHSFEKNEAQKDELGKFIGSVKSDGAHRMENKVKHVLNFVNIFLNNPGMTLQGVADYYNASHAEAHVTKAYVYDCLTSKDIYDVLGIDVWNEVDKQMKERRHIGNAIGSEITNHNKKR